MPRSRWIGQARAIIVLSLLAACSLPEPQRVVTTPPASVEAQPIASVEPSPEPSPEPSLAPLQFEVDRAVGRLLCSGRTQPVYQLPPAFGDASHNSIEPGGITAPNAFRRVGDTAQACDAVRLVGRLPARHAAYGDQPWQGFDWVRARIGRGRAVVGWVDLFEACIPHAGAVYVPPVCDMAYPEGNAVARAARRAFVRLPVLDVGGAPEGRSDLAILPLRSAYEEGDLCFAEPIEPAFGTPTYPAAHEVRVRNIGTGATPSKIQVKANAFAGPKLTGGAWTFDGTITFTFLRGLQPGESVLLLHALEGSVVVDPHDRIPETNEANNAVDAPGGPTLVCD